MDLDELIRELQNARALYGASRVLIAPQSRTMGLRSVPGMTYARRLPIADGSCLGDEDGEVTSLFIVTAS